MTAIEFVAGESKYPVFVGRLDASAVRSFLGLEGGKRVFGITDSNVWNAIGSEVSELGEFLVIEPGERSKTIETWSRCHSWLAQEGADRRSIVLAVGGGVVSDLAGFVASTYMRGIGYATIATSLLAQVDAALGGKTGIDLPEAKNMVGTFYKPMAVWCDPAHLRTLPDREYRSGMAEAIKYGFALDGGLVEWLEASAEVLAARSEETVGRLIVTCASLKAGVVRADAEDRRGLRAVLNFGHTIGHAVEVVCRYEGPLHGEAVMIGMIGECEIGRRLGLTPPDARSRLERLAESWGLPRRLPVGVGVESVMSAMMLDKKATDCKIAMALLQDVGRCSLVADVEASLVREVLSEL